MSFSHTVNMMHFNYAITKKKICLHIPYQIGMRSDACMFLVSVMLKGLVIVQIFLQMASYLHLTL